MSFPITDLFLIFHFCLNELSNNVSLVTSLQIVYLTLINLLTPKHHSTQSTLLSVYNHIINAMSQQKITALCLLDLSAAFDTIDHSILERRLSSWFGLNGTVLFWLQSYLSSRNFVVNLNGFSSPPFPVLQGVPQGFVLGPLLFILYTTPQLSHLRLICQTSSLR